MNKTKLLTIAVVGLLILNAGILAFLFLHRPFHAPNNRPGGPGEGPKYIIVERLHLNQTQQKQYDALVEEHRSRTRELHDDSNILHDKMFVLLKEDTMNDSEKNKLITEIAENQKQIEELNLAHFLQIKSLCKGIQLKYFDELVNDLGKLFAPQHPPK